MFVLGFCFKKPLQFTSLLFKIDWSGRSTGRAQHRIKELSTTVMFQRLSKAERVLPQCLLPWVHGRCIVCATSNIFLGNYFVKSETSMLEPITLTASCQQPWVSSNICKTLRYCHFKTQGNSGYVS